MNPTPLGRGKFLKPLNCPISSTGEYNGLANSRASHGVNEPIPFLPVEQIVDSIPPKVPIPSTSTDYDVSEANNSGMNVDSEIIHIDITSPIDEIIETIITSPGFTLGETSLPSNEQKYTLSLDSLPKQKSPEREPQVHSLSEELNQVSVQNDTKLSSQQLAVLGRLQRLSKVKDKLISKQAQASMVAELRVQDPQFEDAPEEIEKLVLAENFIESDSSSPMPIQRIVSDETQYPQSSLPLVDPLTGKLFTFAQAHGRGKLVNLNDRIIGEQEIVPEVSAEVKKVPGSAPEFIVETKHEKPEIPLHTASEIVSQLLPVPSEGENLGQGPSKYLDNVNKAKIQTGLAAPLDQDQASAIGPVLMKKKVSFAPDLHSPATSRPIGEGGELFCQILPINIHPESIQLCVYPLKSPSLENVGPPEIDERLDLPPTREVLDSKKAKSIDFELPQNFIDPRQPALEVLLMAQSTPLISPITITFARNENHFFFHIQSLEFILFHNRLNHWYTNAKHAGLVPEPEDEIFDKGLFVAYNSEAGYYERVMVEKNGKKQDEVVVASLDRGYLFASGLKDVFAIWKEFASFPINSFHGKLQHSQMDKLNPTFSSTLNKEFNKMVLNKSFLALFLTDEEPRIKPYRRVGIVLLEKHDDYIRPFTFNGRYKYLYEFSVEKRKVEPKQEEKDKEPSSQSTSEPQASSTASLPSS